MERAVLCACLIDPNGITRVIDQLVPASFYEHRHQLIYGAAVTLFRNSTAVDILTISDTLRAEGTLEKAGGDAYLAQLSSEVATSAHAEFYAKIVQERFALRELITTSAVATEQAFEATNVTELLDSTMSRIYEIYAHRQTGGFEKLKDVLAKTHEQIDKLHKMRDYTVTGMPTGFDELDEKTSGFQPGDLVIIAARPSMGKTAFALDIARNTAEITRRGVAFFSLEMASEALAMRLLASEARIDLHRLRSGKLPDRDWSELSQATGRLSELKMHIDDSGSLGINELRARARRLKQQHDIGVVFIDYLQLMQPPPANNREQEVAQISRALKGLARELNVPVVALSQLSRAVEQRGGDKIPQLADLRDSGAIEQDADLVMFIHRKKQYHSGREEDEGEPVDNIAEIIIRKQRNGPTGTIKLIFNDSYTRFDNKSVGTYNANLPVSTGFNADVEVNEEAVEDVPFDKF
jgi:replicative DNA helicase